MKNNLWELYRVLRRCADCKICVPFSMNLYSGSGAGSSRSLALSCSTLAVFLASCCSQSLSASRSSPTSVFSLPPLSVCVRWAREWG